MGEVRGYSSILLAAVFFGAAATVGTLLLRHASPLVALVATYAVAVIPFIPFGLRMRPARADARLLLVWVLNGAIVAPVAYFYGLAGTTATEAALLSNLEALFTVVLAYAFLQERMPRLGYVGIAALLLGAVAVTTNFDFLNLGFAAHLLGNGLVILSALCWGIDNNISRTLVRRYDPRALPFYKLLLGLAFLAPAMLLFGGPLTVDEPSLVALLAVVFGLAGVAAVTILMYVAFKDIGAMRSGALISTSALFGVLIAFLVLGTPPTAVQLGGGLLMVAGTFLVVRRQAS